LFSNRYKSIVCEKDPYFKELVRYIHLNPLRVGLADSYAKLEHYRWCGHGVVLERFVHRWQDREYVLKWFGREEGQAKRAYRAFVEEGISRGRRPELTGGGLVRSMGGWSAVKALRFDGTKEESDERILGSGEFVSKVIRQAEDRVKYQVPDLERRETIFAAIEAACKREGVTSEKLKSGSRRPPLPGLRKTIALMLVNQYGVTLAETARQLGISTSGVAQILKRSKNSD
jgi:hypothetical protein